MAARTANSAKRMETIIKTYMCDHHNSVTILSFIEQLKKTGCFNVVSEGVAMYLLPLFRAKCPAALSIFRLITKERSDFSCLFTTRNQRSAKNIYAHRGSELPPSFLFDRGQNFKSGLGNWDVQDAPITGGSIFFQNSWVQAATICRRFLQTGNQKYLCGQTTPECS